MADSTQGKEAPSGPPPAQPPAADSSSTVPSGPPPAETPAVDTGTTTPASDTAPAAPVAPPAATAPPPAAPPAAEAPPASADPQADAASAPVSESASEPPNPVQPATAPAAPAPAQNYGQPVPPVQAFHPSQVPGSQGGTIPNPGVGPGVGMTPQGEVYGSGMVSPNIAAGVQEIATPGGYLQAPPGQPMTLHAPPPGSPVQQPHAYQSQAPTPTHPAAPGVPVPQASVPQPDQMMPSGQMSAQVADPNSRVVWIFINRNPFVIHLPHPNDPGTTIPFGPCPDRNQTLGMLDFKTHPFFANFVGFKRSISQEPAPSYLGLSPEDIDGAEDSSTIYDLMRMPPEKIAEYIKFVAQSNPDIAAQISRSLSAVAAPPSGRNVLSQAPPGV